MSEVQLPGPVVEEAPMQRAALEALCDIRRQHPELSEWRPTAVMRLDDSVTVLDDSHAFTWDEDAWRHVELPGPAPLGVGRMGAPEETVKGDGLASSLPDRVLQARRASGSFSLPTPA